MSKTNGPFCWQNKETLRGIRESLDACTNLPSILGVYHALTEIASNEQSNQFTTTQSHIAQLAGGISTKTVGRCLKELRALEIISTELSRLKGPLRFDLLRDGTWSPNDKTLSPNDGTLSPNDRTVRDSQLSVSRRTLEESLEEIPVGVVGKKRKRSKSASPDLLTLPSIPTELDTPAFRAAWEEWIQYRHQKGLGLLPITATKQLNKLAKWGESGAIASIDASISSGRWPDLYEQKGFFPTTEQIVPSTPKAAAPDGWQDALLNLYPDATVMPWDQLTQLHPEVADQVMNVIAERKRDGTAIVQNTL